MGVILGACFDDEYMPDLNHLRYENTKKHTIYARGSNKDGHLGTDIKDLKNWTELTELPDIVVQYKNLYFNRASISVINNNSIYVTGDNSKNKLGISSEDEKENLEKIEKFTKVPFDNQQNGYPVLLSNGVNNYHSFIYTSTNKLFASGDNSRGTFGNGEISNKINVIEEIPKFWKDSETIKEIYCNNLYSVFLTTECNVYGSGYYSAVSKDESKDILTPQLLFEDIKQVSPGDGYVMLLTNNGILDMMGYKGMSYELTEPTTKKNILLFFNDNEELKIKSINSGSEHVMVICENGSTYMFGNNQNGQIGNGKRETGRYRDKHLVREPYKVELERENEYIVYGSCGNDHNVILSNKNNIFTWGNNWGCKCHNDWVNRSMISYYTQPQYVDKVVDVGLNSKSVKVKMVVATNNASILVVDQ